MKDGLAFSFAADGGWVYNAPKKWSTQKIPEAMANKIRSKVIKDFKCVAFGTQKESYFYSYLDSKSETMFSWGNECPATFMTYLKDATTGKIVRKKSLRVVFGPNNGYFAWDEESVRWSKIPEAMEACIQGWLSPAGWKSGPPRHIALGAGDAWIAVSQYGAYGYSFPGSWSELNSDWKNFQMNEKIAGEKLLYVALSASHVDHYVFVLEDDSYIYNVPEPMSEVCEILDSMAPEELQEERRQAREQRKAAEKKKAEEEARKRQEAAAKAQKEAALKRQLAAHFATWRSRCETNQRVLTTFPHIPIGACNCQEVRCVLVKNEEDSLKACQHDVEQLLRSSGSYSLEWLRKERLQWHPDRFGRQCDPDFRRILTRKATELYAIFEILIDAERGES